MCSENEGADQLRGYREADLHLCFRICKNPVFSHRSSFHFNYIESSWKFILVCGGYGLIKSCLRLYVVLI